MTNTNLIDLDDEVAVEYLADCRARLATMDAELLSVEKDGADIDGRLVNRVFKAVRSIKGGAIFFNLLKVRELACRMEDVLALIVSGTLVATPRRVKVLLRATARLYEMIQNPASSNEADILGINAVLTTLTRAPDDNFRADVGRRDPRDGPLKVLLVEDDFASRLVLETFLSRYGECHTAANGTEAVGAFRATLTSRRGYDLICMDIMMPEMDGCEAVKQIRAIEEAEGILSTSGAKIIMTTTVSEIKNVVRCFRELCDAYLLKPIDLGRLLNEMKACQLLR